MLANTITLCRILLTFGVIVLFELNVNLNIACIITIVIIFVLDAVDGTVARIRNETSKFGAIFDVSADRIIENIFWVYFSVTGYIPLWIPLVVLTRGILTDNMQQYLTEPKNRLSLALTKSRISRGAYGTLKMITFLYLSWMHLYVPQNAVMKQTGVILAIVTVAFCVIRGLPTIIECTFQLHNHSARSPQLNETK